MDFLPDILILFALAVAVVLLFHKLRLPSIVGFLVTGVIAGPHGLALIGDVHRVEALAEIGVVLLLFTVGLEFSINQLVRLRSFLLSAGALQVGLTIAVAAALIRLLGLAWPVAVFGGMLLSLSSTAIVLRLLSDEGEIDAPSSQATLGILVFQDLCIVPMMLLLPVLGGETAGIGALARDLALAAAFIALAFVISRFLLPRLLQAVVATRKREVFILTVFLFCLAAAWASSLIGLSLALGAFIAGLVVSESPYAHQALSEVLPLREVFNSLFFISIGMLFDVRFVATEPLYIAGLILAAILLKITITGGVTILVGLPPRIAIVAAFTLAQVGEFSFVLGEAGRQHHLLAAPWDQRFIAASVGTMALTPLLIAIAPSAAAFIERILPARWRAGRSGPGVIPAARPPHEGHVIIIGYGLNGRNLARVLEREQIPYVVVEMNPQTVRAERARGRPIIYGGCHARGDPPPRRHPPRARGRDRDLGRRRHPQRRGPHPSLRAARAHRRAHALRHGGEAAARARHLRGGARGIRDGGGAARARAAAVRDR